MNIVHYYLFLHSEPWQRMSLWRQMVHEYELDMRIFESICQNVLAIKTATLASIPKHYQRKLESVVFLRVICTGWPYKLYSLISSRMPHQQAAPPFKWPLTWNATRCRIGRKSASIYMGYSRSTEYIPWLCRHWIKLLTQNKEGNSGCIWLITKCSLSVL